MKIIHIALGKANPNRMNGVNKVVYQLANMQVKVGYDVDVWGITPTPEAPAIKNRAFGLELFKQKWNPFLVDKKMIERIKEIDKDVIFHFHGGFVPQFFSISRILIKNKLPYVLTSHGNYNPISVDKNRLLKTIYTYFFESRLIKWSKALHFMGQTEYDAIKSFYPDTKKYLIPNGQDLFKRKNLNFKKSKKLIFSFIGRIDIPMKGLDLLLKGFKKYLEDYKGSAMLDIIGDGGEINELKKICKSLNIQGAVNFKGAMFGVEKLEHMASTTVFFHPSRNEGLPGAILEAASLGLPCVVSKATNMGEYIRDYEAGIVLAENDADHLASAMKKFEILFLNKNLKQFETNSRSMIEKEFNWTNIALQHCQMYAS